MTLSTLPLGYCTNVHPGRTLDEVEAGLERFAVPAQKAYGRPMAVGLWLASSVIEEMMRDSSLIDRLKEFLDRRGLVCYTMNAFPYGDFHGARVKEGVYLPDWSMVKRMDYTTRCALVLDKLLPPGVDGSLSTLPLGFKPAPRESNFNSWCHVLLEETARKLESISQLSGRKIRLAIEPEPFCLIETTDEAIAYFERLYSGVRYPGLEKVVREHIGLCYDVCHQAVEFEDAAEAVRRLDAAGIRIVKSQLSCAIELQRPGEDEAARRALATYVEPRYLHQTMARAADGKVLRAVDLTEKLALHPPADFEAAETWRVHFHVPVDAERIGPLGTTRAELKKALAAIARLPYAPHLEIETYTWTVLPGETVDLAGGLARELTATQELIAARG